MAFNEPNFEDLGGEAPLPEESSNSRTFMIALGILVGIILISLTCLGGVYIVGKQNKDKAAQQLLASTNATETAVAFIDQALTATFNAEMSLPTTTSTPEPTSVVNLATATLAGTPAAPNQSAGAASTSVAITATIGAAYTQAAIAQLTVISTTTALPSTGIADELGLPGLVVMALAFVIVILLARRLRIAPQLNR